LHNHFSKAKLEADLEAEAVSEAEALRVEAEAIQN
jgi:hypothetical protein